jgi:hypothetical protein
MFYTQQKLQFSCIRMHIQHLNEKNEQGNKGIHG